MADQSLPSLGVRCRTRRPDDRVYRGTRRRRQEGKKGVKTLALRGPEVVEMGVKNPELKFRTIFPEVRHFPVVETSRN